MQKSNKAVVNNYIDEIIDDDDFDNISDLTDFFKFVNNRYRDYSKDPNNSNTLEYFNLAVFIILMDKFDLKDLYNSPDEVNVLYYLYYCLARGVKDIDLSPWTDHMVENNPYPDYMLTFYDSIATADINSMVFSGSKAFSMLFNLSKIISPVKTYNINNILVKDTKYLSLADADTYSLSIKINTLTIPSNCYVFLAGILITKLILIDTPTNNNLNINDVDAKEIDLTNLSGKLTISADTLKTFLGGNCKKITKTANSKIAIPKIFVEKIKQKLEII